ncbi:MAG: hypothetical protein V3U71_03895 [Cocleimonas sp.]
MRLKYRIRKGEKVESEVNQNYKTPSSKVEDREFSHDQTLQITTQFIYSLRKTKSWLIFLSILGFIVGVVIIIVIAIDLPNYVRIIDKFSFYYHGILLLTFTLLLFAGFGILITSYSLLKYVRSIKQFIANKATENLEKMFVTQASFWKVTGIFVLLIFGLLIAIIVASAAVSLGVFTD